MIHNGDCVEVMAAMPENSVDAIVCDPPYGLEFMGKEWDRLDAGLPQENVWKGRRGKGGSSIGADDSGPASRHHVSFGGGKTGFKRCTVCGKRAFSGSPCKCPEPQFIIEYPEGAPSSSVRMQRWHEQWAREALRVAKPGAYLLAFGGTRTYHRLAVAIEDAGWIIRDCLVWAYASGFPKSKALLKPAWEPIVMARKPGPLRELAIDACRIPISDADNAELAAKVSKHPTGKAGLYGVPGIATHNPEGRWPANVILTDGVFDGGIEGVVGGGDTGPNGYRGNPSVARHDGVAGPWGDGSERVYGPRGHDDTGTYSRFFLIPKSSRSEREPTILPAGHDRTQRFTTHPTVKPVDLMRHLVRLVTPQGGLVLDPFLGSGTTAIAAEMEGFAWVGIEREAEYCQIAEARLMGVQKGLGLDVPAPTPKPSKAAIENTTAKRASYGRRPHQGTTWRLHGHDPITTEDDAA